VLRPDAPTDALAGLQRWPGDDQDLAACDRDLIVGNCGARADVFGTEHARHGFIGRTLEEHLIWP
jgi:hypothetical protein